MPQFLGSSVVEQLAVNQLVVGSNPTRGAILKIKILMKIHKNFFEEICIISVFKKDKWYLIYKIFGYS